MNLFPPIFSYFGGFNRKEMRFMKPFALTLLDEITSYVPKLLRSQLSLTVNIKINHLINLLQVYKQNIIYNMLFKTQDLNKKTYTALHCAAKSGSFK